MFKFIVGIVAIGLIAGFGLLKSGSELGIDSLEATEDLVSNVSRDSLGQFIQGHDFGADMYVGTHDDIEDLLSTLQKKYAGKAVILDLWGTFCKPCIADFKNSPAKKKVLKDEMDVHMVYLCAGMSSNINEWKKIVEREKLIGDHIYLDRNQTMAYRERFNIKRYPNYILMDKEGNYKQNIISAVNDIRLESFKQNL